MLEIFLLYWLCMLALVGVSVLQKLNKDWGVTLVSILGALGIPFMILYSIRVWWQTRNDPITEEEEVYYDDSIH